MRCEEFRFRVEALEAELAEMDSKLEDKSWRPARMVRLKEDRQTYRSAHGMECRHLRWFLEQEGFKTQDCSAEFAQLRRLVEDGVRNNKDAPELGELRRKLSQTICAAPRG